MNRRQAAAVLAIVAVIALTVACWWGLFALARALWQALVP